MATKDISLFQMHKIYLGFGIFDVTMWYNLSFGRIATWIDNMNKKWKNKNQNDDGITSFFVGSPILIVSIQTMLQTKRDKHI
jgi:hypothetical protein